MLPESVMKDIRPQIDRFPTTRELKEKVESVVNSMHQGLAPMLFGLDGEPLSQDGAEDLAVDAGGATSDRAGGATCDCADHADLRFCGPRLGRVRGARGVEPTAAGGHLRLHGYLLTY